MLQWRDDSCMSQLSAVFDDWVLRGFPVCSRACRRSTGPVAATICLSCLPLASGRALVGRSWEWGSGCGAGLQVWVERTQHPQAFLVTRMPVSRPTLSMRWNQPVLQPLTVLFA